ncbi:MAG TPA: hydroxysqualene dehydroxylase HpnE [Solirubrobacteraceae bacterium]|nr:hydroxysqualene dehydroxylase HpnE [Solirubrobacteraceae bacterium]
MSVGVQQPVAQPPLVAPARPRVAVVGGGLAGISAALRLADDGARVTLLESRGRLGGAAFSFTRDGLLADNGQHVFLRCCTEYLRLVARIGAGALVTLQDRLSIPVLAPGGRSARLARGGLPAPLHLAGALARYPFLSPAGRLAAARAMRALRAVDPDDPSADRRSFGDWLAQHGQDARAVQALWELVARPTLNLAAGDASLAQAAFVFQHGLLSDAGAADVGYATVPLGEIHDVAARRALARAGVDVQLRRGVAAIVCDGEGFRIESGGAPSLDVDAVVLAVPHDRAARLLPACAGVDRAALARLGSSPIVNLHVVYDRRVLEHPFAVGVDTPVQWLFDRTRPSGLCAGQYLAVSLSGAEAELDMTVEELRARFLPALAELLPLARGARVERFFVTRSHAATFRAAPGSRSLRPGARTALEGLVLAGAFTDTGWPATMEGAVRSGLAAAREVRAALAARASVGERVAA